MELKSLIDKEIENFGADDYRLIDSVYIALDKAHIKRTKNICLIPESDERRGGKHSYAEWAHVIGIIQTVIFIHLQNKENNRVLDVGSGTGLVGISAEPFLGEEGKLFGIDVLKKNIEFCQSHYPADKYEFIHLDTNNSLYTPDEAKKRLEWPVDTSSFDLVTALSVWTHFNEDDAVFYLKEVKRVLKKNGKAIISFFILDNAYNDSLSKRSEETSQYHMTPTNQWVFDLPAYGSDAWFYPSRAKIPESAIGISEEGLDRLLSSSGLKLVEYYQGNWKETPGIFFQDIVVFERIS